LAHIRPLTAIRYADSLAGRLSDLVAPPYDVLDDAGKGALQKKHPYNIVGVDLPHMPPKTVGPDSAYEAANQTLKKWIEQGTLVRDKQPALYAYAQTYTHGNRTYNRRGFFAAVKLSPFGAGEVYPHEKTYPEAIVDRLKLTKATGIQMSPVFGLFPDPENRVTTGLFAGLDAPQMTATLDGVKNELWTVSDPEAQRHAIDLMASRSIYIADGHHRYTMALQYQKDQGKLPADHPANYALFVLVAMQDPGLLILPTHRIIGGLSSFDAGVLRAKLGANATLQELAVSPDGVDEYTDQVLPRRPANTFGLYDGTTKKLYELCITNPDVLKPFEPNQSAAWRSLDVAILQRYMLDEIIAPTFAAAGGASLTKSYTADSKAVVGMTDGATRQIALILKSTPLKALEDLGKQGEVMPQKSTYFFPKLLTGMVLNPLD